MRRHLQRTVLLAKYDTWLKAQSTTKREDGVRINDMLADQPHWENMEHFVRMLEPMVKLLRITDGEQFHMGKLMPAQAAAMEIIRTLNQWLSEEEQARLEERWLHRTKQSHTIFQGAAFLLDPEYNSVDHGELAMQDFRALAIKVLKDLREVALAEQQLAKYLMGEHPFLLSDKVMWTNAGTMPPHHWWAVYGKGLPALQKVAIISHSQTSSASACERSWSTHDLIHNKKRNRLNHANVKMLVNCHANRRYLKHMKDPKQSPTYVPWGFVTAVSGIKDTSWITSLLEAEVEEDSDVEDEGSDGEEEIDSGEGDVCDDLEPPAAAGRASPQVVDSDSDEDATTDGDSDSDT
jgi:hypothetical protein